ncbi:MULTISPECIES: ATP-binding protein [Ramlibacter]|uniref:histidine kinase n=1 Tax=Ramlibacter aquaticus TaxID=2780094 RepID=A0ABR9SIA2_9BURK|nr:MULTISPECIES: ATP-binding protein [Ramlibacter]MBE7942113.1 HAMP domain-containing protein [Ramlibacter aquaticus]
MTLPARWRFPLYLRIWLAVLVAVLLLSVAFGWLLQASNQQLPVREVILREEDGTVLGRAMTRPVRTPQGLEFAVAMHDGRTLIVQLPPRPHPPGEPPPGRGWMMRGPAGLFWMLAIVALAVALGSFPIVRRMTQRLERLRSGVERWGDGDLSVRVDDGGNDEVAALARRFNLAAERVDTLVKTHKSLLANASHELRSPLARIRMGLELMGSDAPPAFQEEIRRNITELDQLVDEILLASRLDAREADMGTVEPVDLTGLVAEECAHTGAELAASPGVPLVVDGVPRLLRRAVRNLLENARRYSSDAVRVELVREGPDAVLRVRDRGPGVPPAQRERIFEPFHRLPGASERHGGVGLGLALVRSIAERHRGRAWCEDQPGGGACFVIRIPVHAQN